MRAGAKSTGLALLLGFGAVDLLALNLWVLPPLLLPAVVDARGETQTALMAASERDRSAAAPRAAKTALPAGASATPTVLPKPSPSAVPNPPPDETAARGDGPTAVAADRVAQRTVVMFRKGTWWIGSSDREQLTRLAATAVGTRTRFEIDGYADESGPADLNQRISRARADAIADLLVLAGVDRSRIAARARGELPIVRGDGSDERRAELHVLREDAQ
jgi:outer membrane protein OmpA-like peptidoglycan-associated protein